MNLALKTELDPATSARISRFPVAPILPSTIDSRKFRRVPLRLSGRCLFADRREHECQTINISQGGAALICAEQPEVGSAVVLYLDFLGRIQGKVVRAMFGTFAVEFDASPYKRDRLKEQLDWLENRPETQLVDARRSERISPVKRDAILTHDGASYPVKIIDVSRAGAAVQTDLDLPEGAVVTLGMDVKGRVSRTFFGGVGIAFFRLLPFTRFDENITFDKH